MKYVTTVLVVSRNLGWDPAVTQQPPCDLLRLVGLVHDSNGKAAEPGMDSAMEHVPFFATIMDGWDQTFRELAITHEQTPVLLRLCDQMEKKRESHIRSPAKLRTLLQELKRVLPLVQRRKRMNDYALILLTRAMVTACEFALACRSDVLLKTTMVGATRNDWEYWQNVAGE